MTTEKQAAVAAIEEKADLVAQVADQIWSFAELSLQEEQSAALYCRVLEQEGFKVERGHLQHPHRLLRLLRQWAAHHRPAGGI